MHTRAKRFESKNSFCVPSCGSDSLVGTDPSGFLPKLSVSLDGCLSTPRFARARLRKYSLLDHRRRAISIIDFRRPFLDPLRMRPSSLSRAEPLAIILPSNAAYA